MRVNESSSVRNNEILIVDNSDVFLKLLSDVLENEGYIVRPFDRSESALLSIGKKQPSLILLDIRMPDLDGYELCRQLKAAESTRDIPVIFTSDLDDEASEILCFQIGGVDFITKPFRKEEVLARVRIHLRMFNLQMDLLVENEKLNNEIQKRKRIEEDLLKSEFFFRESQRAAFIGSYKYDFVTGFWDSSEILDHILGINNEYVRNVDGWKNLIFIDDREMMDRYMKEEVIGKRKPLNKENRIIRKSDGKIRWVNGMGQLICDAEGNLLSLIGTVQDITKRKRVEEALKESDERYNAFANANVDMTFLKDDQFRYLMANNSMAGFFGKATDELINQTDQELTDAMQVYPCQSSDQKALREDSSFTIEEQLGGRIYETTKFPVKLRGNKKGIGGIIRDITERKQAEKLLKESEEKFRNVFENSSAVMLIIDPENGNLLDANNAAERFYGWSRAELSVMKIDQISVLSQEDMVEAMEKTRAGSQSYFQFKHRRANSPVCDVEVYSGKITLAGHDTLFAIIHDISERKKAEIALLEAESKMNAFFNQSLDGFFFMMLDEPVEWNDDADKDQLLEYVFAHQRMTRVNAARLDQHGATLEQVLGRTPNDLFAHDLQNAKNTWRELYDKGKLHVETDERKLNGKQIIIEGEYTCLYDLEGRITGHFGIQRDITESKRAKEIQQDERQLLRTLIDNLPDPVYVKDCNGRKILANLADVANIGKHTEEEVLGKTDLEMFDAETGMRGYLEDMKVLESGEPLINQEELSVNRNGVKVWLHTTKVPLFDKHGKINGLVGIGHNITEQKELNETINKLSKGIEQSPSSIVITDVWGNIEYVNPKFSEITGYAPEEVIGKNSRILKSGEMSDVFYQVLWDKISSGNVWRGEFHNRKKNGELYWAWASITSIKNTNGVITNYMAIKEDVSERKQMEVDLILAKEKAEESDRLKSDFLANMSHEIRTPLNSIIGFSELLFDPDFEPEQKREFIQHIIGSGNNLLTIISDIMDISKMESGQMTIHIHPLPVGQFLDKIRKQYSLSLKERNLDFQVHVSSGTEQIEVLADNERLHQIFNNLISNAQKFTSSGYIHIGYRLKGGMIEFFVQDSGIGISPEFHDTVFERFRQVETSMKRNFGGTGLGLAITRNLVELMGGNIWLDSEAGKGSVFYFTLPGVLK